MKGLRPPALLRSLAIIILDLRRLTVAVFEAKASRNGPAMREAELRFRARVYDLAQHPLGGYVSSTLHVGDPAERIYERNRA